MKKINLIILIAILFSLNQAFAQRVLSLEESKQLALENNTQSKNSKLEIEASKQIRKSALTNYFPQISAGGLMWSAQKSLMEAGIEGGDLPVYDGDPANLGSATQFAYFPDATLGLLKKGTVGYINAVQPIFAGGRIFNGNKLASLGEEVSEFKDKLTQDEILLKTEEQYWQIVSLEDKFKTIEKYEDMLDRLLIQTEDAFNAGIIMKNDMLKVKVKLSELLLNKSKVDNGITLAKMAFSQHLGISYDSTLILEDELVINELPQTLYVDNSEALPKRKEYSLLELSVRAEELQSKMKLGEYLPQVAVGLSGMYMKFDEGEDRTLGIAFGTVSVPISGWWGGAHELEKRSIEEKIAKNNFENNSELLLLQMKKAWTNLTEAYKQYLLSMQTVEQAEENLEVNQDSYENGLITVSDLIEAQAIYQEAQDKLIEAMTEYKIQKTKYLQVTAR